MKNTGIIASCIKHYSRVNIGVLGAPSDGLLCGVLMSKLRSEGQAKVSQPRVRGKGSRGGN